jgi:hypothetical protein
MTAPAVFVSLVSFSFHLRFQHLLIIPRLFNSELQIIGYLTSRAHALLILLSNSQML